jgi:hypothetical protein
MLPHEKSYVEGVLAAVYEYTIGRRSKDDAFGAIRTLTSVYAVKDVELKPRPAPQHAPSPDYQTTEEPNPRRA